VGVTLAEVPCPSAAQSREPAYEFLLDTSGSMAACTWVGIAPFCLGGETWFEASSRKILAHLDQCFAEGITFGLRIFPNAGTFGAGFPTQTSIVVDPRLGRPEDIRVALRALGAPNGETPLAHALEAAKEDLAHEKVGQRPRWVVLVTDGVPTLSRPGGSIDPIEDSCIAAQELHRNGVGIRAYALGEIAQASSIDHQNLATLRRIVVECGQGELITVAGVTDDVLHFLFGRNGFLWLLLFTFCGAVAAWAVADFFQHVLVRRSVVKPVHVPPLCKTLFVVLLVADLLVFVGRGHEGVAGTAFVVTVAVLLLVFALGLLRGGAYR